MNTISPGGAVRDPESILEFQKITLSETGTMAATMEYEVLKTAKGARVSLYYGPWNYHEGTDREDCLEGRKEGDRTLYIEMAKEFEKLDIRNWNGFSKSASGVLDGTMFSFEAVLSDGKIITARGSNAFPRNYGAFKDYIRSILE